MEDEAKHALGIALRSVKGLSTEQKEQLQSLFS